MLFVKKVVLETNRGKTGIYTLNNKLNSENWYPCPNLPNNCLAYSSISSRSRTELRIKCNKSNCPLKLIEFTPECLNCKKKGCMKIYLNQSNVPEWICLNCHTSNENPSLVKTAIW